MSFNNSKYDTTKNTNTHIVSHRFINLTTSELITQA